MGRERGGGGGREEWAILPGRAQPPGHGAGGRPALLGAHRQALGDEGAELKKWRDNIYSKCAPLPATQRVMMLRSYTLSMVARSFW